MKLVSFRVEISKFIAISTNSYNNGVITKFFKMCVNNFPAGILQELQFGRNWKLC